jgi:hypothetical protein
MATRTGFLDLPAELRNQIYHDYISSFEDRPAIKPDKLNKAACISIFHLLKALNREHALSLLLTDKQIMHEALPLCLELCTLRLHDLDQLDALRHVRHDMNFQKIGGLVRSLTLDISMFGYGLQYPRTYHPGVLRDAKTLIPLHGTTPCWHLNHTRRAQPRYFADLLTELKTYFPNTASITVEVDNKTLTLQHGLRSDFFGFPWPSVCEFKFRRPDLEARFTRDTEEDVLWSGRVFPSGGMRPPQAIPWQLEMQCRFLESVNESLAEALCKRRERASR